MLKTMDKLVEKLSFHNKPINREQREPHIRNPNFRRPQVPQIRQREQINEGDNKIKPPFQNNLVDKYYAEQCDD